MNQVDRSIEVVDDVSVALSRCKSPAELTKGASKMFSAARERLRAYLSEQHPEWDGAKVRDELRRRIHGTT